MKDSIKGKLPLSLDHDQHICSHRGPWAMFVEAYRPLGTLGWPFVKRTRTSRQSSCHPPVPHVTLHSVQWPYCQKYTSFPTSLSRPSFRIVYSYLMPGLVTWNRSWKAKGGVTFLSWLDTTKHSLVTTPQNAHPLTVVTKACIGAKANPWTYHHLRLHTHRHICLYLYLSRFVSTSTYTSSPLDYFLAEFPGRSTLTETALREWGGRLFQQQTGGSPCTLVNLLNWCLQVSYLITLCLSFPINNVRMITAWLKGMLWELNK